MDAKLLEIYARIEAEKAMISGMEAENEHRKANGYGPAYNDPDFGRSSNALTALADELKAIVAEQKGKA